MEPDPAGLAERRDPSLRRRRGLGTFDYFTEAIVGKEAKSRGDYTSSEDDNVIVQGVSGDQYALGYFGYAYYEQNKDKLKSSRSTTAMRRMAPGNRACARHRRRWNLPPLSRPVFIYAKVKALQRPEVLGFVEFYLSKGPALVRRSSYIPITEGT